MSELKVVMTTKDSKAVLSGIIWALTVKFGTSTMRDFRLVPFQDNAIGGEGLTECITQQNSFLHTAVAILVVDGG